MEFDAHTPDAPPLRRGLFSLEDERGPYEGWTRGDLWNGWACPYFEREVALRIVEDYRSTPPVSTGDGPFVAEYDAARDVFRFFEPTNEEWEEWGGEDVNGRWLYSIGAHFWVWSEVAEPDQERV